MASVTRWSSAVTTHFTYARQANGQLGLAAPTSVSCYVYDPTNAIVYTDSRPLPSQDPNFIGQPGVLEFHPPGQTFIQPTKPETWYTIVAVAQLPDGSLQGSSEIISVT